MPYIPNVLIVDDEQVVCDYLKQLLSKILFKKDYKVITAVSGLEAIKNIDQTAFDLVLLDLSLPDMEGYQVIVINDNYYFPSTTIKNPVSV